ncbi:MAG: ORF6N domain-containing protein [Candidatus Azobacteroides sp.]|nr:ORF6N domain-containing protein [Candidatus Azobacteroides sp.]
MELEFIQNQIFEIRGCKVMLDFHLAGIYGIETKVLKQSVKRNLKRFAGDDFMFELTKQEWNILRSQFVTSRWGGARYQPFAFTELGVAMLSSVLNSDTAIETNRNIMRAFVAVRQLILNPPAKEIKELQYEFTKFQEYLEDVFTDYNDINEDTRMQLELINETLAELQTKNKELNKPRHPIGFTSPQYSQ